MATIDDCVLGYRKSLFGVKKVNVSEYFKDHFDLSLDDVTDLSERDRLRLTIKLGFETANFLTFALRNGYWQSESRVNLIYIEGDEIIQTNPGKYNQPELLENQKTSPYMNSCPKRWLENCLAYNARHLLWQSAKGPD